MDAQSDFNAPAVYHIRLKGQIDAAWFDWLGGISVTSVEGGETRLSGTIADQAALHGLFRKIRDFGITLISVEQEGQPQGGTS